MMPATEHDKALVKLRMMAKAINVHLYDETFHVLQMDYGVAVSFKDEAHIDTPNVEVTLTTETQCDPWYRVCVAGIDVFATGDVSASLNAAFGKLENIIRLVLIQKIEACIHVMDGDSPEGKAAVERAMQGAVRH